MALARVAWGALSSAIAAGAFSLVDRREGATWPPGSGLCGPLLQAVAAGLAGLTLFIGAVQVLRAEPAPALIQATDLG